MKSLLSLLATAALVATFASAANAKPSDGIIKTGPIKSICATKPKACGAGYDPLKRPHKPIAPK